jgi:myo-inositol 2-dehydrogenase/D-chiro-inositol 1-dehydrogenase
MIGFNRRFDPTFSKIKEELNSGAIGSVLQTSITSRDPSGPPIEYVRISGGIFKDMTIHDFDMARFMAGDITSVHAFGQNVWDEAVKDAGDFDSAVVTMKAKNGSSVVITNSRNCAFGYDQRIEVFGEKGMLEAENQTDTSVKLTLENSTNVGERYLDFFLQRYEKAYNLELNYFIDAIINGTEKGKLLSPSIEDGVKALELAEAATKSAKENIEITIR